MYVISMEILLSEIFQSSLTCTEFQAIHFPWLGYCQALTTRDSSILALAFSVTFDLSIESLEPELYPNPFLSHWTLSTPKSITYSHNTHLPLQQRPSIYYQSWLLAGQPVLQDRDPLIQKTLSLIDIFLPYIPQGSISAAASIEQILNTLLHQWAKVEHSITSLDTCL